VSPLELDFRGITATCESFFLRMILIGTSECGDDRMPFISLARLFREFKTIHF